VSAPAERAEAVAGLEQVRLRRLGANRVHVAYVVPAQRQPGSVFGAACTLIESPVSVLCGRTLRGELVEIPAEHLGSWERNGDLCRECELIVRFGLTPAEERAR
jgi:hypothetical protein